MIDVLSLLQNSLIFLLLLNNFEILNERLHKQLL